MPSAVRAMRRLLFLLGFIAPLAASAQSLVLDAFAAGQPGGTVRPGTSWVGQVSSGDGTVTVGGTARDDNGWGARGLDLNVSAYSVLTIVARRDADNAAPALVLQLEDRNLNTHTVTLPTSAFAVGALTTVQVPLGVWAPDFDAAHVAGWTLGGGTPGTVAFRFTFDQLALGSGPAAPAPPVVTGAFGPRTAAAGENVSFTVAAAGAGPFTYQWWKDAAPLAGNPTATSAELRLGAVVPVSAGRYTCVVTGPGGSVVSGAFVLTVAARPATVTLGNLAAVYSGAPQRPTVATVPAGLAVVLDFDGRSTAPVQPGTYQVVATVSDSTYAGSARGTFTVARSPQPIAFAALPAALVVGTPFPLAATAASGGTVEFRILAGNAALDGHVVTVRDTGQVVVRAVQAGDENFLPGSADLAFTAAKRTQSIAFPALPALDTAAAPLPLTASASSGLPVVYSVVVGPAVVADGTLRVTGPGTVIVRAAQPGNDTFNAAPEVTRTVTVSPAPAAVAVPAPDPAVPPAVAANVEPRLINVSTRASVGAGDRVAIAGFNIAGDQPKSVLIRAVGPTLGQFGVAGFIAAPKLELFRAGVRTETNTGWTTGGAAAALAAAGLRAGAFALGADAADSALVTTLAPGSYTAVISSGDGRTGVGLVEVYDLSAPAAGQRIANLSVRAAVGSGDETLVVGVVVEGPVPKRLLVRAVGPGLAAFGVADALARVQLALFSGRTELARNTGWSASPDAAAIAAGATQAGAFALAAGSGDSALVVELAPGAYTAQVAGLGATGVALVEIYELR